MKAVVFIDVQNDFVKGGKLAFGYPIEDNIQNVIEFAKHCIADTNCKIYATRDTHEATKWVEKNCAQVVVGYLATLEGQKLPVEHCIEGTDGWMIDNRLMEVLDGKCTFVNKPTFGSFDLAEIINEDFNETYQYIEKLHCNVKCLPKTDQKFDEIVICGFCTDICVVSNALLLRAKFPNTKITVMKDLCAGVTPETHEAALKTMQMCQIDVM